MPTRKKTSSAKPGSQPTTILLRIGKNIEALKKLSLSATDLAEPMNFFMDELAEDPDFFDVGKPSKDKTVSAVFKGIAQVLYQQQVNPQEKPPVPSLRILSLEKFNFFHSGGSIGNQMLTFVYFKDIDMGIGAMAQLGSGHTTFTRFSASQVAPSDKATFVANSSRVIH